MHSIALFNYLEKFLRPDVTPKKDLHMIYTEPTWVDGVTAASPLKIPFPAESMVNEGVYMYLCD